MTSSATVTALLADYDLGEFARASEHPCQASRFHSPRPLLTRHYDFGTHYVSYWLCGTCAGNIQMFLLVHENEGELPWSTLREFGNEVRRIGNTIILRRQQASRG